MRGVRGEAPPPMTVRMQPLGARILVELIPLPEKVGSIILPSRRETAVPAKVLGIGPEVRDVQVGDRVLIPALSGQEVGGNRIIAESNVLGFVE